MTDMLGNALIALIITLIPLALVGTFWLSRMISASTVERRNTDRRLGLLEDEIKDFRRVFIDLGSIKSQLQQVIEFQKESARLLGDLSKWQQTHQKTVEDAGEYIREHWKK